MRLAARVLLCLFVCAPAVRAQSISPTPAGGDLTVTVLTDPAAVGDAITLHLVTSGGCSASSPVLPLAEHTNSAVLAGGTTTLTLASPLTAKMMVCAVTTGTATHTSGALLTAPATPAAAPSLVPEQSAIPLTASSTVPESIAIDAVLVPGSVAKRIFGKEIANHYAVVQIVLANHNQNASFILESAKLDHREWLFSKQFKLSDTTPREPAKVDPNAPYESQNTHGQIASVESRMVRSQLEDAQAWSWRNVVVRGSALVGTVAASYVFLASDPNFTTGVSSFGNQVVPAIASFWPDRSQAQINNISDYGFRTPKVFPKASSDIIVAFFPLDDFLISSMKSDFISSPAMFSTPMEMLTDTKKTKRLNAILSPLLGTAESQTAVSEAISRYLDVESAKSAGLSADEITKAKAKFSADDAKVLYLLDHASINNMHIIVDGIMAVDVNSVPATVASVVINDGDKAATWALGSTVTGTLSGSFLGSGVVTLASPVAGVPTAILVDPKTATDARLDISFKLTAPLASGTELDFVVTKTAADKSVTTSQPTPYTVTYTGKAVAPATAPTVTQTVNIENEAVATTWVKGAVVSGSFTGAGLGGATVVVTPAVAVMPITVLPASTPTNLKFSFTLNADVATATVLNFVLTSKGTDGSTASSSPVSYTVTHP